MLVALNTEESCSKQQCDKADNVPHYKTGDLIMIKNFDKNEHGMQNMYQTFVKLIGTRQLEVADPTGILRKVNILDVHRILPAGFNSQLYSR